MRTRAGRAGPAVLAIAISAAPGLSFAQAPVDAGALEDGGAPAEAQVLARAWDDAGYSRRTEITRALVAMDDRAVAALVVSKRSPSPAKRAWAADTLESMGRERADEQIRTSSDAVLAGIFRAYGEARDPDALGVLSSFVGSEREALRSAARDALLAYGKAATSALRQDYTELAGEAPPPAWTAEDTARALFAAADRIRLRDVHALLDRGLARAHGGDLVAAVEDLDGVLARHEGLDRREDVARVYATYASGLEDSDPARARAYFERARRVDPASDARFVAAEIAVLDGRELEARGAPDEAPYRRALELDPANARARAALDRLEARSVSRRARLRRWTLAGSAAALVLAAMLLFVGRRARRSGRRRAHAGM